MATAPTPGAYRLFLEFKHQGAVRTAAFNLHTTNSTTTAPTAHHEDHTSAEHQ
ncbi:hypothetical protein [Streptomyces virginiae]|uniref:hypothetical protein n=1 Tax=Streptomyces virginiae TaxID=1961 RepID=UPI0036F90FBE